MEEINNGMKEKRKEFEKVLVFSVLGILLFYILLPYIINLITPSYKMLTNSNIFIICFIGVAYLSYLISKTKYDFIILFRIMVITFFLLVHYLSLLLCHKSSAIYFFYIPLLLMLLIIYNIRITAIATFIVIILTFVNPYIAIKLNISKPTPSSHEAVNVLNILEIVIMFFSAYLSLVILYYYNEFYQIQLKSANAIYKKYSLEDKTKATPKVKDAIEPIVFDSETEKFENLYNQITIILEKEKLFQDSSFNKKELAHKLKTNETYISIAINNKGNKTFNSLINEYRINQVIEDFKNKRYKRETIEYIYKRAGFTQQSTFNRVFKEFTGRTPSEYIDQIEN